MTAKDYLKQARYIDGEIKTKISQVEELRELAVKAESTLSDMPGSPTRNTHKMENTIIKILMLADEISGDINDLVNLKKNILDLIKAIDDEECRIVLEKRYLNGERWQDIADDMHCGIASIHRVHSKALRKIKIFKS